MTSFEEGTISGGTISSPSTSQSWNLRCPGQLDLGYDEQFNADSSERPERVHVSLRSDDADLRRQRQHDDRLGGIAIRLQCLEPGGRPSRIRRARPLETYEYNGLGQRIAVTEIGTSTTTNLFYSSVHRSLKNRPAATTLIAMSGARSTSTAPDPARFEGGSRPNGATLVASRFQLECGRSSECQWERRRALRLYALRATDDHGRVVFGAVVKHL